MSRPAALLLADTHGYFVLMDKIIRTAMEEFSGLEFILHAGDMGVLDARDLSHLPQRERILLEKHENPTEEFLPYLTEEKELPLPMYHIPGNHEDFFLYDKLTKGNQFPRRFYPMEPAYLYTYAGTKNLWRMAGLGKLHPHHPPEKMPASDKFLSRQEIDAFLYAQRTVKAKAGIFIFHEAPYLIKCENKCHFGHPFFSQVIRDFQPRIVICGHMHFSYTVQIGASRVYGLPATRDGFFGILYDDYSVTLHHWDEPGKTLEFSRYPEGEEKRYQEKSEEKKHKTITAGQIFHRFGLPRNDPHLNGALGKIIVSIRKMEKEKGISREDAFAFAEKFLLENGFLRED